MEFSPQNHIVKLCLEGIANEDQGKPEVAAALFLRAWNESANSFEKFIVAFFVARHQENATDKLKWLESSLQHALEIGDDTVTSAFYTLYSHVANCHAELNDPENAKKNLDLAESFRDIVTDKGPFYHGTKAELHVGDFLTPGNSSNYSPGVIMNHVYFAALINGAGLAAALAKGNGDGHVYVVEPTGSYENDPNVTDKKFPGNLTRSYRTQFPLKIIGEITDWARQTSEDLQQWRNKLANAKGDIIN